MSDLIGVVMLAGALSACERDGDDAEVSCPDLSGQACAERGVYQCDACGNVYSCGRYEGTSLTWGWANWPCECVGESGELVLWDTATNTGNPDCVYSY